MVDIKYIEKIPEVVRELVREGLGSALKKGKFGRIEVDYFQIETFLSGGKTGAVVFLARFGKSLAVKKRAKKKAIKSDSNQESTFIRVLKIATRDVCLSENAGYLKTRQKQLDIFSILDYFKEDEFTHNGKKYGILLYQDVGTVAASDLKSLSGYLLHRISNVSVDSEDGKVFSRALSSLIQKEIFLGLKKGLYGTLHRKNTNLQDYYGRKLSGKVKKGVESLQKLDENLLKDKSLDSFFNFHASYHYVEYIHGDLNPQNVLIWENDRGFLSCKLIDFGEVVPKSEEKFTPLFWDFSRLFGETILNLVEEKILSSKKKISVSDIDKLVNDFFSLIESYFQNKPLDSGKIDPQFGFISGIYLSNLFDFINEAKSGMKDLFRIEVLLDYFYCQAAFYLFFAKYEGEDPYKRLFGVKLGLKIFEYAKSDENILNSILSSLEQFYFNYLS